MYIDPHQHTNKGKDTDTCACQHIHMHILTCNTCYFTTSFTCYTTMHSRQIFDYVPTTTTRVPPLPRSHHYQPQEAENTSCDYDDYMSHLRLSREPESPSKQGAFSTWQWKEKSERLDTGGFSRWCWLWRWRRSHARSRERTLRAESMTTNCKELNSAKDLSEWRHPRASRGQPDPTRILISAPRTWAKPLELWDNKLLLFSAICSNYWLSNGKLRYYACERTCPYSLATSRTFKT